MDWYQKLSEYFPIEEMKSREHMERLLREKGDIYHKDEGSIMCLCMQNFRRSYLLIIYGSPQNRAVKALVIN